MSDDAEAIAILGRLLRRMRHELPTEGPERLAGEAAVVAFVSLLSETIRIRYEERSAVDLNDDPMLDDASVHRMLVLGRKMARELFTNTRTAQIRGMRTKGGSA